MEELNGTVIVGSQYGDEGKGKITDIVCEDADYVVRYQGGNNAGHTIVVGDNTFKLHLLPSGVIHGKKCFIGSGVVVDPRVLMAEIADFEKSGRIVDLVIDRLASIIMPYHNLMDGISESSLNDRKIGTTGKGIGPAYEDHYSRRGIRFSDLLDRDVFARKLHENFVLKQKICENVFGQKFNLVEKEILEEYMILGKKLEKYMGDVSAAISGAGKKRIIFESAQGTFLDVRYGTYPFVTSSHPISGGVFTGIGIPPQKLDVIGIVKAYTTRVGSGPFPTELMDATGKHLQEKGHEYGTTTGRLRRCGWLDLVMLRYAHRLNGFTSLALTKLDVLSGLDKVKVASRYLINGKEVGYPLTTEEMENCSVEYAEFDGFEVDPHAESYDQLEGNAKKYLGFIEKSLHVPIKIISVGPDRAQTLFL